MSGGRIMFQFACAMSVHVSGSSRALSMSSQVTRIPNGNVFSARRGVPSSLAQTPRRSPRPASLYKSETSGENLFFSAKSTNQIKVVERLPWEVEGGHGLTV